MAEEIPDLETDNPEIAVEAEEPEFIELFSGAPLNSFEAEAITLQSLTHVVVFAGAEGSGKTTILSSIYERLNQGPFGGNRFAGSRTLFGFEEICHLNRIASGATRPETPRTQLSDEVQYYHIALRSMDPKAIRRNILFSAMSGELFRMARDSQEEAERLTFVRRADTLVILVDGERLANNTLRANAHADAVGILDCLLEAKLVSSNCLVDFVFSKSDRISAAGEAAVDFVRRTQEKLEAKFRARVPHLSFRSIAARPAPEAAREISQSGIAEALESWITPRWSAFLTAPPPNQEPQHDEREFLKHGWRYYKRKDAET